MDPELLTALKALSDASRLRIVGLLADGRRMPVEQLAAALGLTPGTVVHHLKRLRDAGLRRLSGSASIRDYFVRSSGFRLVADRRRAARLLPVLGRTLSEPVAPRRRGPCRQDALFCALSRAKERLMSIPAQHSKRLVVLRQLAETLFERKRKYPEKEVNQLLAVRHPDAASLRRYLVDEGFMTRKSSVYRLRPRREWPQPPAEAAQRSRAKVKAETAKAPAS